MESLLSAMTEVRLTKGQAAIGFGVAALVLAFIAFVFWAQIRNSREAGNQIGSVIAMAGSIIFGLSSAAAAIGAIAILILL